MDALCFFVTKRAYTFLGLECRERGKETSPVLHESNNHSRINDPQPFISLVTAVIAATSAVSVHVCTLLSSWSCCGEKSKTIA